jgi:hypothetical protein
MTNQIPVHAAKHFRWKDTVGTTMASDLGYLAGRIPGGLLNDHNDDIGFMVQGKKSILTFELVREIRDPEQELIGWIYDSNDREYTVCVFND